MTGNGNNGREGGFVLLPAKVSVPAPDGDAVVRERAAAKLAGAAERPLTTIVAPAGFGKTTAAALWAARAELAVAWCALDEDDAEAARFWAVALAALGAADRAFSAPFDPFEVAWADATEAHNALALLIVALGEATGPVALVLEDVHAVQDSPLVADGLAYLVRNLPANAHVLMTSRTPVRLPLAKLRAAGRLGELSEADLRLTPADQAALLAARGVTLGPADAERLDAATQGWPAGCRLVGLRCADGSPEAVQAALAGARDNVSEYLFEEVLAALPAGLLDFMAKTSVVNSFSVALAAAITGLARSEVRGHLDDLFARGLFLQRIDGADGDHWYRYHQMLLEALWVHLKRLPNDGSMTMAARARAWYLDHGFDDAAVGLSFWMRDWEGLCAIIQDRWKALYMNDENGTVLRWVSLLPAAVLEAHPFICAVAAMPSAALGDTARAQELLQRAMLALRDDEDFLFAFCAAQKALVSALAGKRDETLVCAEKALRFLPEDEGYLRAMMIQSSAGALWRTDPLAAKAAFEDALALQESLGSRNVLCSALANLAALSADLGHLADAERYGGRAEGLYEPAVRPAKPMLSFVYRARATIAYERGDEAAFAAACEAFRATAATGAMTVRAAELEALEAKAAWARGDRQGAVGLLGRAMAADFESAVAMAMPLPLVRAWCDGARDRARALSVREGEGLAGRLFNLSVAFVLDDVARYEAVRDLVDAIDPRCFSLRIRALTLGAAFADKVARRREARRFVREAYRIACDQGLVAAFCENAPDLRPLVDGLRARGLAPDAADAALDGAIAAAIDEACRPAATAADRLTERELECLRVVADGASVAEAAEVLVVSRETVKKHLGNIYAKLGVHSKMQAVALLREEGTL